MANLSEDSGDSADIVDGLIIEDVPPDERITGEEEQPVWAKYAHPYESPPEATVPFVTNGDSKVSRLKSASEPRPSDDREPSKNMPSVDEWLDFFSRIVLRLGSDWYIGVAFRGIDEEVLSEREIERIQLKPEERNRIARPWAELSYKNKFMRKHGRSIVSTTDSIESLWILGMWINRVNRVAAKHRPKNPTRVKAPNVSPRQSAAQPPSTGGPIPNTTGNGQPPDTGERSIFFGSPGTG